ncbi:putative disease resistance RPP13-like protein 3 [Coffea eugenioides]|uniref:putative disease resistance RPP13-like protein 3 n=1 Tax=Coffea eugenioides TaxID=49369 RepID=UPI000F60A3AA|nr:putative disease resistance RPP13-like protein 3 [Coffea eugenioides]
MADPVISFVVERTGDLLIQKIVFLKGVRRQVKRLQNDLVRMRCFLKDADQKQIKNESIRNWVSEIRAAAYDAEDIIEIFASKVEFFTKDKGLVTKLTYYPLKIVNLYKIGKEIESLRMRLKEIADSRQEYGIENLGEGTITHGEELQRLRRSSPFNEDKDIVGFEEKTKSLVAELLKEDENRRVVSIIGMGGVGKTTLAKKVYNHADVRARFDCRAWVCVSSSYDYKKLLSAIIKQLNPTTKELLEVLEMMQEEDLERRLYQDLQDKCYLVVLDDVWEVAAWDCLARRAFPDVGTSSRVLLTSRNRDVAQHADASRHPYELKTLGEEDSWQLFLRKALGHEANAGCPPDLEEVGREIARRCGGLPLAITVIGGLLLGKNKSKTEWENVLNNFGAYLSRSQSEAGEAGAILELSYADLPANLKFCFLYLGLFPEDSVISVRKLIHLWVAEGIMQKRDAKNLEETAAYDEVERLCSRNMVQVAEMTVDERIKSCRVHDLLRDLAIRKAEDENFFQIHGTRDDKISAKSRYLAVHSLPLDKNYFGSSNPPLRSLLFSNVRGYMGNISLSAKSLRKLRILDLENVQKDDDLPKEIGEVRLLRYLNLRGTYIPRLPLSVGCLRYLQTLDIRTTKHTHCKVKVSNFIWKLESLRHLYAYDMECDVPLKIEGLRNLQTLSGIRFEDVMYNNMITLTSLQKLGIVVDDKSEIDKLCMHLSEVGSLKTLHLLFTGESEESEWPSLDGLSKLHHVTELKLFTSQLASEDLIMLRLARTMLPPDFPPNLSRLSLKHVFLEDDPMPVLEKLGQLSFLKLELALVGPWRISRHGFHQLKFLELSGLIDLKEIEVEEGALPQLRCLRIRECPDLAKLPEELKHISTLDALELVNMSEDFISGLDADLVSRVPNLRIYWDLYFALRMAMSCSD